MSPPIKKPRRKKADSEDACESTRGQRNDESPDGPADDLPSFEESLAELGRVVAELEQGDLSLAESLEQYEAGIRHLRQCYRQLEQAERRVELLTSVTSGCTPLCPRIATPDGFGRPVVQLEHCSRSG